MNTQQPDDDLQATVEELRVILQNFAALLKADEGRPAEEGLSVPEIVSGTLAETILEMGLINAALNLLDEQCGALESAPGASDRGLAMLSFALLLSAADLGPFDPDDDRLNGLLLLGGLLLAGAMARRGMRDLGQAG